MENTQMATGEYKTQYADYSNHAVIMISTDRMIFNERSAVYARMIEYAKSYKELHIIVFAKKSPLSSEAIQGKKIAENCTVYSTNSFSKFNYIKNAFCIGKRILRNIPKDEKLLISCQDPFETALAGKKIAGLRNGSELLLQIHTDLFSPYFTSKHIGIKNAFINKIRLFLSHFTLGDAQVIRVVSRKIADSLVKYGIDANKIIVKPIGVDIDALKNAPASFDLRQRFPQFKKIIIMVSRLESEKNIDMAILAMAIVNKKAQDTGLIIIGSGSLMNSLKRLTHRLNLDNSIIFEGWQTDIIPYYKTSDIVLITSWYEGYGMIFKEAQACGRTIVSTDVGIARDVGAHIVGWNKEDIAQKLIQLL